MKRGKGMLSARDTLRFLLQAEEEVLRRYLSLLLAAGSRALRTELQPLFSSALEDRAALKELLCRVSPERADEVFAVLRERALIPSGCYSHFREPCAEQLEIFSYIAARARAYFPDITLHMASSGTVGYPAARFDMVRVGHAAYGGAMSVESRVVAVRHACAGECVGYGHFTLNRDTNIAVVFGGYFDGVRRGSPAVAVIGGRRCPSLGSVCMDMFAVDVGGVRCSVGDRAILMGKELPASEIAAMRGTVDYDVMTGWTGRMKRIYSDDQTGSETEG